MTRKQNLAIYNNDGEKKYVQKAIYIKTITKYATPLPLPLFHPVLFCEMEIIQEHILKFVDMFENMEYVRLYK